MRGRLCSPWPQGQFYRALVYDDLFFPFPSLFGLGRPWGSPGQLHKRWIQLRSVKRCCQSCSSLEREGIHLRGGQVPSSSPPILRSCIAVPRWVQGCVGLRRMWRVGLRLTAGQLQSWQGGLPTCLPRGGQEVAVAEALGAPRLAACCLRTLPALPPQTDGKVHGVPCSCK